MTQGLAFEARRKGWHMLSGVLVTPMVVYTNLEYVSVVAAAAFVFILVAELLTVHWNIQLPFWSDRLARTKRTHERFSYASLAFLAVVIVLLWLTPLPIALAAAAQLALGDGMSALVGRWIGRLKIPYNPSKSWEGSTAGFVAGALGAFLILAWYYWTVGADFWIEGFLLVCLAGAFAATVAESLPVLEDNVTVPAAAAVAMLAVWWALGLEPTQGRLLDLL